MKMDQFGLKNWKKIYLAGGHPVMSARGKSAGICHRSDQVSGWAGEGWTFFFYFLEGKKPFRGSEYIQLLEIRREGDL